MGATYDLIMAAEATVEISKENLLSFVSYMSPYAISLNYQTVEEGKTELMIKTYFSEKTLAYLGYLDTWGQVKSFNAGIYDVDAKHNNARIFLEGTDYYCVTAETEEFYGYGVQEEDRSKFETFKTLCLRDSVVLGGDVLETSVQDLELDTFLNVMRHSDTVEQFQLELQRQLNTKIDFRDDGFYAALFVDVVLRDTEETMTLRFFVEEGDFYISVEADISTFKGGEKLSLEIPTQNPSDVLSAHLPEDKRLKVKWDFMKDQKPLTTLLDLDYARELILNNEESVDVQYRGKWVSPCSVCVNRLAREFEDCRFCAFELME